jgi:hypothetical protein
MYCNFKFVVHKKNSKMVVLIGREKADVANADVVMGWML